MAKTCATSEGDLLDTLCQHYYGHLVGSVEAVLDAAPKMKERPE